MTISNKILHLRKKLGYTQEELADKLNVSRQSISKWESGHSIPDIDKIMIMAKLFSVSIDYLLRDEIEVTDIEDNLMNSEDRCNLVTIETANDFNSIYKKHSIMNATAVFLCIIAAIPLLLLNAILGNKINENITYSIGISLILILVVIAIGLFIYSENLIAEYKYIISGKFELSYNVEGIIKEQKKNQNNFRIKNRIISLGLLMLSPIPIIISGLFSESDSIHMLMIVILLTVASVAIFRLIYIEGVAESYEILLFEGDYTLNKRNAKKKKELVYKIYWSLVTAIYFTWSFISSDWGITWIVWPTAGLLSTLLSLLFIKDEK